MAMFYVRVCKKHLVYVRRLAQRYEPSSLQQTRGFIYYAGMGHKVMVTAFSLLVLLGLALFYPCNNPRIITVHGTLSNMFHPLIRISGV
jgi:hypothetical protein